MDAWFDYSRPRGQINHKKYCESSHLFLQPIKQIEEDTSYMHNDTKACTNLMLHV